MAREGRHGFYIDEFARCNSAMVKSMDHCVFVNWVGKNEGRLSLKSIEMDYFIRAGEAIVMVYV